MASMPAWGETLASLDNFKVDPSIVDRGYEIVFRNEVFWDILNVDPHKLQAIHWCGQIKVADVKARRARIAAGEDAIDNKFNNL